MSAPTRPAQDRAAARANGRVGVICLGIAVGMLGLAFASVPFYRWFCKTTGYDGTPGVATVAPNRVIDRTFEVRFDSNVHAGLPWSFRPEVASVKLKAGEVSTVIYRIENQSDETTRGVAAFNVTPELAGAHFNKLACFCFTEQTLGPREVIEAPVTFYVDPSADEDKNLRGLETMTLSYTFFAVEKPPARAAAVQTPASTTTSIAN